MFKSDLYLKWFTLAHPHMEGMDSTFTNVCILLACIDDKKYDGFTVFEARDLNQEFVTKLIERDKKSDSPKKYVLYTPPFLKHRVDALNWHSLGARVSKKSSSFIHLKKLVDGFYVRDRMRIVSVDDSPVMLKFLGHAMDEIGFIDVVARVSDSTQAVETILKFNPDLVTMDIQMPKKNGVQVVTELFSKKSFMVIMVSSLTPEEGPQVFEALNAGAFDYLQKPKLENKKQFVEDLSEKILLAVSGKKTKNKPLQTYSTRKKESMVSNSSLERTDLIWCIGASTGGTQALTQVMTSLPTKIPPTFIVQHIPPVFSKSFADSLNNLCPFTVKEAENGEPVLANHVYIAPGGLQMGVRQKDMQLQIDLSDSMPVNRFKPSVDYLFKSIVQLKGFNVVAGILTGMGKDGAEGLLQLKKKKALTFAQDESTCAVFGMPRAAIEIGAADNVVSIDVVAQTLLTLSQKNSA